MRDYQDFLNAIIDDGIEEVRHRFTLPQDQHKLQESIRGFESCRGVDSISSLKALLIEAGESTEKARRKNKTSYWWYRYRELQIEWVCNVLSAMLVAVEEEPIITPTVRGWRKAQLILDRHAEVSEQPNT